MFSKESDHSLEVRLPDPYFSLYRVNFVQDGEKFHIIVTGEWARKLSNCGYAFIQGVAYSAEEEELRRVLPLFRNKYGERHVALHGMDGGSAFSLERDPGKKKTRYEILEEEFDHASSSYEEKVRGNPVESYMRQRTTEILAGMARNGMEILEIGCGTMIESSSIRSNVKLTCAELSRAMIRKAVEHSSDRENIDLKVVKVNGGHINTGVKYDIIFTTYGYMDLEDLDTVTTTIGDNLKSGGIFIGAYWNRLGLLDMIFSFILGRFRYLKEKLDGFVLPEFSRFTTATRPKMPLAFGRIGGFHVIGRYGICTVIPPYNFSRIALKLGKNALFTIDRILGSLPPFKYFSDYVLIILRRD